MSDTTTAGMPKAWRDLLEAITILARHPGDEVSPFHCEHDQLTVMADPANFTAEELAQLDELGFFPDDDEEETFASFRFGSA